MKSYFSLLAAFALICLVSPSGAQVYVNRQWVQSTGLPDSIKLSSTTLLSNGYLVTVGNTLVMPGNTDLLITMYNDAGMQLWQDTYDGFGGQDYGVAVKQDAQGSIIVAGASENGNQNLDIVVLKYSMNGSLAWTQRWNGASDLHDIPSSIETAPGGSIYIAGSSMSATTNADYLTIKYSANGTLSWDRTYDYNGFHDAATAITIVDPSGDSGVVVTGASGSSLTSWDYTSLTYASDGTKTNTNRVAMNGLGFDEPSAIARDAQGNIYITGTTDNSGDKNILTVKLDSTLQLTWYQTFNGESLEDCGRAIGLDSFGNVYVTGFTRKANGGTDYITIKYADDGTELWNRQYFGANELYVSEAYNIAVTAAGDCYVTGTSFTGSNLDFATVRYDAAGNVIWVQPFSGSAGDDVATNILTKGDHVYVTGLSRTINGDTYTTLDYATYEDTNPIVFDSTGTPLYVDGELILKFNPSILKSSFINDRERQFGYLDDIVDDSVISAMGDKLGLNLFEVRPRVLKIYRKLTQADSFSISRSGDTVKLDELWSVFTVTMPGTSSLSDCNDSLNTLPDLIFYSEANSVGTLDGMPNDPEFTGGYQKSLVFNSTYPNAHINLDPVWNNLNEMGRNDVKVGVFDHIIDWRHEDFGDGTYGGSKIKGGGDYITAKPVQNVTLPVTSNQGSHGTQVAGIIGALNNNKNASNNYVGIAGIAGGDVSVSSSNTGVRLYSMGIVNSQGLVIANSASSAIIDGALDNPNVGYGLHIQNHSWGKSQGNGSGSTTLTNSEIQTLKDAVKTCLINECVFVASNGNVGGVNTKYPAIYPDKYAIAVGASGNDGKLAYSTALTSGNTGSDLEFTASYGANMDLIAPGISDLVKTTTQGNNYSTFNGASAAAPHVTGVAALLYGRHRQGQGFGYSNSLSPEDIERVLEIRATDIASGAPSYSPAYNYTSGYDQYSGWGRLNAGDALLYTNRPHYEVIHSDPYGGTQVLTTVYTNFPVAFVRHYRTIPASNYLCSQIKVTTTFTHTIPSSASIIDYWPRHSASYGLVSMPSSGAIFDGDDNNASITLSRSGTQVTVTAVNYVLYVKNKISNLSTFINKWVPDAPANTKAAYSLYIYDPLATNTVKPITEDKSGRVLVYPNPANTSLTIEYSAENLIEPVIQITDAAGKLVRTYQLATRNQSFRHMIPTGSLPLGMYFIKVSSSNEKALYAKFIKQ